MATVTLMIIVFVLNFNKGRQNYTQATLSEIDNFILQWKVKGDGCVTLCLFLILGNIIERINEIRIIQKMKLMLLTLKLIRF